MVVGKEQKPPRPRIPRKSCPLSALGTPRRARNLIAAFAIAPISSRHRINIRRSIGQSGRKKSEIGSCTPDNDQSHKIQPTNKSPAHRVVARIPTPNHPPSPTTPVQAKVLSPSPRKLIPKPRSSRDIVFSHAAEGS